MPYISGNLADQIQLCKRDPCSVASRCSLSGLLHHPKHCVPYVLSTAWSLRRVCPCDKWLICSFTRRLWHSGWHHHICQLPHTTTKLKVHFWMLMKYKPEASRARKNVLDSRHFKFLQEHVRLFLIVIHWNSFSFIPQTKDNAKSTSFYYFHLNTAYKTLLGLRAHCPTWISASPPKACSISEWTLQRNKQQELQKEGGNTEINPHLQTVTAWRAQKNN